MKDVNKIRINLLNIKKGDKVLDVGCSYGEQAIMIARQGLKVTGIDSSKKLIGKLNKLSKKEKMDCKGLVGNINKMPFKADCFDAVIATEVLEHIADIQNAARECFRVLKRGGRACISVPTSGSEKIFVKIHPDWIKNSGHLNIFTKKEILNILTNSGFKVSKIEYHNFEWSVFWLIHSFLKTDFDDTGKAKENQKISQAYFNIWNNLFRFKIGKFIMFIGNKIFPKSLYVYLVKP